MAVVYVSLASLGINLILGKYRANYKKMSWPWWLLIHASIPILVPLRIGLDIPVIFIPLFIVIAIIGQFLGARYFSKAKTKHTERDTEA
ncbi:hypothetical protein [Carboxylicivirga taeanensis]|uniref:hypothetical protein n=1 Tax=Carboxylicivirga taeanensis TaxID=1416875 RepID=UPI003F6E2ECD